MLIAITALATFAIRIPTPTGGHINFGDTVIIVSALIFGAARGAITGGIGSALADLIGGHNIFIPGTLIIKALEGWVVGTIESKFNTKKTVFIRVAAAGAGAAVMVAGYFIYEIIVFNIGVALSVLIPNTIQGIVCVAASVFLYPVLAKIRK